MTADLKVVDDNSNLTVAGYISNRLVNITRIFSSKNLGILSHKMHSDQWRTGENM